MAATHARIDLSALAHNLAQVRREVGQAQVWGVVKANAYGHGLLPVSRALAAARVDGLCVARAEEGLALRAAGVATPVLVLEATTSDPFTVLAAQDLTIVVHGREQLAALRDAAGDRPWRVHLKIDTGMSRLGVPLSELGAALDELGALHLEGVMTHLASAEDEPDVTERQLDRFQEAIATICTRGHTPHLLHAANTAGALLRPRSRCSLVRAGLALYGVPPREDVDVGLRPVMRLRSEVMGLRELLPGDAIGYGGTHRVKRPMRIATLPIGYGDGLLRAASDRAAVLIAGKLCPVVGRVSMDLTTVNVDAVADCRVGDEAVLIGTSGDRTLTAADLAQACGTIPYEVLTTLAPRVSRVYA